MRKERFPRNYHGAWYRPYGAEDPELVSLYGVYITPNFPPAEGVIVKFENFNAVLDYYVVSLECVKPVNKASRILLESLVDEYRRRMSEDFMRAWDKSC